MNPVAPAGLKSFMPERQQVLHSMRLLADAEEDRHKAEMNRLKSEESKAVAEIEARCLATNGKHVDDGGMFFASCANCGFSDDFYDCG